MPKNDNICNNDHDPSTTDSDSMHKDEVIVTRRSSCIRKPINRLNLTTWLCYLSTLPQILISFKQNQEIIFYHSTVDNLLNDMYPLACATGYAENEVFHLGNMLKQDDYNNFFTAIDKEVSGHNESNN